MNKTNGSYRVLLGMLLLVNQMGVTAESSVTIAAMMHQSGYQQAWQKALKGQKKIPVWVRKGEGPSTPANPVYWQGQSYHVGQICKVHDCGNNFMYVAFSEDKKAAWGLRIEIDNKPEAIDYPSRYAKYQWLGKPDEQMKSLLTRELKSDPNWR